MKYLIDGHNLIARLPDISLADPHDEAKLIRLLARWRWRHNSPPVTVVFDPGDFAVHGRRRMQRSGISVRYAPYSSDADTVLIRLIERHRQPAQLTVVSSDREIQSMARRVGAQTISAEEFAMELTAHAEPQEEKIPGDEPLSPEEVEAWLEIFQDCDDRPEDR
ncbi:MAG: NYN domain-containing protein [Anaerolineae bacterium]